MNLECQRWIRLADLEAVGEPLASEDTAFLRSHEASCAECAREAAIWRQASRAEGSAPPREEEVERILTMAAAERVSRWKRTAAIGAMACAATLIVWLSARFEHEHVARLGKVAKVGPPLAAQLARISAEAERSGEPHCSQVIAGATVCLERKAMISKSTLDGPDRALEVARGRVVVSLTPQPAGTSFSLTTNVGRVTAVGTIFSVEVGADGATTARVIEGHVMVRANADGVARSLLAGQAMRVGDQQPTQLSDRERDLDLELLSHAGPIERDASKPPRTTRPTEPRDMLEYARSLRASGDFRRAAEVYRSIHAANPQSPSGRAALVSLGDLLLSRGDAQGALTAFDSYLTANGALAQEALFGRVRALRALNRPLEERRAIERFLAAYPSAPQSRLLRARLDTMQK
jgi:hypothetical protein